MYRISVWNWLLLLVWPLAIGYGLAYLLPPKNLFGLVLGGFWFAGWIFLFVRDQRSSTGMLVQDRDHGLTR